MARQISRKPTGVVLTRVPRPKASWSFRGGGSSRLRPSSPRAVATPVRPSAWRRVSDPDAPPLEEARIVEVLDRHQVDYVLVGGMGARLHGATKLHRGLRRVPGYRPEEPRTPRRGPQRAGRQDARAPDDLQPPIDGDFLARIELGTWRTTAGDLSPAPRVSTWRTRMLDNLSGCG